MDYIERVNGGYIWHRGGGYDIEFNFEDERSIDNRGDSTTKQDKHRIIAEVAICGTNQESTERTD